MRYISKKQTENWEFDELSESPVTQKLSEFFFRKFPSTLVIIALCKCLSIVSCKLPRPRLTTLDVAPSRQLKSYTLNEARKIFSDDFWINLRSDFTIHSLERYKKQLRDNRSLLINDATTLLASKAQRTKDRLIGGLSELLADEAYTYQDFNRKFVLKGWTTLVMNITAESYQNYKDRLLGLTFLERVVTLYHCLTKQEMIAWIAKQDESAKISFDRKITISDIELKVKRIPTEYFELIQQQAQEFSYISLRGFIGCQDSIKGIVRAHASLNKRKEFCADFFYFCVSMS
jgi:hypothetical protein